MADRPIYLRQHLMDVHKAAVEVLKANVEEDRKRLVSLVGCPGTGKTWCGWLVAYSLHKKEKNVLHVTIRINVVIVVHNFETKKTYKNIDVWRSSMLEEVLTESKCDVCLIDVGEKTPSEVHAIFGGVRSILENGFFPNVKFFCMVSGHGEENICGKDGLQKCTQRLLLWSWSEEDFKAYNEALKKDGKAELNEEVYGICGGSVRYWFDTKMDQENIRRAVKQLSREDMARFLTPDHRPTSNTNHHQHSRVLAFFCKPKEPEDSFKQGVMSAFILPRSDYVIRSIRAHSKGSFGFFKKIYEALLPRNPGAAGTPFEILVHYFWEGCIIAQKTPQLKLTNKDGVLQQTISVNCCQMQPVAECEPVESWDNKDKVDSNLLGYFTPQDTKYPTLDSILRYKSGDQTKVLAIQVSIGQKHAHGEKQKNALLQQELEEGEKTKLALWDHRDKNRTCVWTGAESDHWDLVYVRSQDFDEKMRHS